MHLTRSAGAELFREGLRLHHVRRILEEGSGCPRSRRKIGIVERCLAWQDRNYKAVVAESYNFSLGEHCWVVIHLKSVKKP